MDATQAIIFSDEEDSEQEQGCGEKNAVAFLHVLAQKELSATKHPIYEGDNYIGRHDSNSIHMPYKALSKQHACIEVQGHSHLIYDMESRNKTRRGKMFLKPNVRYELRDDDVIIFGDVKCQYILQSEQDDGDDTGSDTDSELMLRLPDSEDIDQDNNNSKEDLNESSFSLNDFMQPTQPCIQNGAFDVMETQAVDNMETQAINSMATLAVDNIATQAVDNMATLAVDNLETQVVDGMETQAVDNMATLAVDNLETQAVDSMETQAVDNMATLAVDNLETQAVDGMETQAVNNMATLAVDNLETQAVDSMETQAVDNMATLAVDNLETQSVDGMATQAVDNMATLAVDNLETQAIDGVETQGIDNMATLAVDNLETQAIDGVETQGVDNMATLAVDNLATQAVDYGTHSDSSDTDIDDVRQSILEAPTQAVGLNDSRQQGTPKECSRTLVLDSSADSSDIDDSPVKQARNMYDEPTQVCDSIVSDSDSETDIEDMVAETQAVVTGANQIDEMATIAIDQVDDDDGILKERNRDISQGDKLNVPALSSDDNTEMDSDMGNTSQEYFLDYRSKEASADEAPSRPSDVEATQPYQGHPDDDDTEETPSRPGDVEATQPYQGLSDDDNTEETPSRPGDVEATQPYQGHPDDDNTEETTSTHKGKANVAIHDATQRYGDFNKDETTGEPTSASSVTMEIPSTQAYGAEEKQPDSHGDDETDPTVAYHTKEDVAMEMGDSEIESTQAYGMQGGNTQVPDSQDGDDEPTPSRFPIIKTQSPSRSCLKQPNTPDRKETKSRRVMFQSTEDEEGSQESDGDTEPLKRSVRSRGRAKGSKSLVVGEEQTSGSRRNSSRVSRTKEDKEVKEAQNVVSGTRSRRSKAVEEAAVKPGQKRKVDALEQPSTSSATVNKDESNAKRGKKQGRGKVEEEKKEDTVDGVLTMTDAKPTRKKEFDEENPRPSSGKGKKVKDERKLSGSSISSVGSEGSRGGRALKTIVQIGKKLTRGSKKGKKSDGDGESTNDSLPVVTKRLENTADVVDDGDSDDTASISSTASSVRDFDEVKPSTRPTRAPRNQRSKDTDEPDSQSSSGIKRSRRGGTEKKEITPLEDSEKKVGGRAKRGVAEDIVTEVDGPSTQSRSRTRKSERSTQGDEPSSQDDSQKGVSTKGKKGVKNEEEVKSKRTRRGTMQEVKPDMQETNPKENENMKAVELQSEIGKTSKRGKTKARSSGDGEQNVSVEVSIQEDKESQETRTKRKRNATSESQEGSAKETTEVNVRQSGRRRTLPARFVDSDVKDKDSENQKAASEIEVKDKSSTDAGVFAVPKAVGRPSRKTQKKESSPSSQGEVESETVRTSSRGRRSTAKVTEEEAEKDRSEQPIKENTRGSRRRGQEVPATRSAADSKADETMTTPKQRRGLAAAANTTEGPAEVGMSGDMKEDTKESRRRGKQKPAEEAAACEKSLVTPTSRRGQSAVAASTAKTSKDVERDEQSKEVKSTEVAKTRGKRGAPPPSTPPQSSPAKIPRHTLSSPSISPARRRRGIENKPKVMFTGVMDDSWQKAVTTLGGELGNSVDDCTHLVTDKVRRTVKFLCSMARGIVIVKPTWLHASMTAKTFVDPTPYQLKDKAAEGQYSFSLQTSIKKANENKLFNGFKIHVTRGVKPDPQQMRDIITCAGGEYVTKLPTKPTHQLVIVSCDGDKSLWAGPRKAGIAVVSSEFILTGILRQDILLKDYQLK